MRDVTPGKDEPAAFDGCMPLGGALQRSRHSVQPMHDTAGADRFEQRPQ